jgi:transcriptional antiterminator RfaH
MSYWAVVHTQNRHEDMVCVQLVRAEFEIYLPRIKLESRIAPLFPGYLFVRIVDRWYPVRWTRGVIGLLPIPAQLQEKTMNEIRKREGRDGFVKLPSPANRLRNGQQVRITRGNFEGQIALCEGMSGKDRVRVLLNMLGQKVPVELPSRDLEPLPIAVR